MTQSTNRAYYQCYQPNPNKCKDCGIRALMCATGRGWFEIFDELVRVSREHQLMPSSAEVIAEVSKKFGFLDFIKHSPVTVAKFVIMHPHGTFLIAGPDHVVCVKDGHYYDAFDSADVEICCFSRKVN